MYNSIIMCGCVDPKESKPERHKQFQGWAPGGTSIVKISTNCARDSGGNYLVFDVCSPREFPYIPISNGENQGTSQVTKQPVCLSIALVLRNDYIREK